MRKMLSAMLAGAMVLSMATTAFAAPQSSRTQAAKTSTSTSATVAPVQ